MRMFITQKERSLRLVAVHCPCCGGRVLDAAYGVVVTYVEEVPHEPPDYIIKCWRCKRLLGIRESAGKGDPSIEDRPPPESGDISCDEN